MWQENEKQKKKKYDTLKYIYMLLSHAENLQFEM